MKNKTIIYLLLVLFVMLSCSKDDDPVTTGDITGIVRNSTTSELISGAMVSIPNISSTQTNLEGRFTFEELAPQTYEVHIIKEAFHDNISNITVTVGQTTQADVQLSPILPELDVSVEILDFGETSTSLTFSISNTGYGELTWNVSELIPWLSLEQNSGTVTNEISSVTVNVDRTNMNPGNYQETITIGSNGGSANILVKMSIVGPVLTVNKTYLNFGTENSIDNFIISNTGIGDLDWQIGVNQTWITVYPNSGSVAGGGQILVIVEIDRSSMTPGNNYFGTISIISTNSTGSAEITVTATEPSLDEPLLTAFPTNLNFGIVTTEKTLHIQNNGTGQLDWAIDYNEDWLQFSETSGNTNSGETDDIIVIVDRTGLGVGNYSDIITITSNGGTETVNIDMEVEEEQPILSVNTNLLDFGETEETLTFTISNTGTGDLEWDLSATQGWIAATPISGTNNQTITVTVDRTGLDENTYYGSILIISNGGDETISISMEVVSNIPTEGLIAEYLFTNGSAEDTSGNNNNGINNGAIATIDRFGNDNYAFDFNGLDDYISLGYNTFTETMFPEVTLSVWFKTNIYHDGRVFDGEGGAFPLVEVTNDNIRTAFWDGYSANWYSLPLENNTWTNICVTYANGIRKIYKNGEQSHQNNQFGVTIDDFSREWTIGTTFGHSEFFNGKIDDIRIYDRALTADEIIALYHEGGWESK